MKPTYDEQYCVNHDQYYARFLDECPICAGEAMVEKLDPSDDGLTISEDEDMSL